MYLNNCILLCCLIITSTSIIIIIPVITNSTSNINDMVTVSPLVHSEYDPIQE